MAFRLLSRAVEMILALLGLTFVFFSGDSKDIIRVLSLWDLLAVCYLAVGTGVARHARRMPAHQIPVPEPAWLRALSGRRAGFAFSVIASLMGLSAALGVAVFHGASDDDNVAMKVLGVVAIACAWMLLHAGYARYYRGMYYTGTPIHAGLAFPGESRPGPVEFLYFAFTLGTTFAVSDVEVTSRLFRWHVTVHSVVGFFYNAVVLAFAIGLMTGK